MVVFFLGGEDTFGVDLLHSLVGGGPHQKPLERPTPCFIFVKVQVSKDLWLKKPSKGGWDGIELPAARQALLWFLPPIALKRHIVSEVSCSGG